VHRKLHRRRKRTISPGRWVGGWRSLPVETAEDEQKKAAETRRILDWLTALRAGYVIGLFIACFVVWATVRFINGAGYGAYGAYDMGWLQVRTDPPVALSVTVDSRQVGVWGVWLLEPVGTHVICFGNPARLALVLPPCRRVAVKGGRSVLTVGKIRG
jgi:hypothetical protein